ncbi:MAG TPA: TIGR01777 family oxidoreductase [Vicinamibacteria bacterium]|nr:TIGR01777 family oxidoreductase [Vicinamibacteria bacterium]
MRVAVTGASGLIGGALVPFLRAGGHDVLRMVRRTPRAQDEARWDPESGELDASALGSLDAVVHLAGENIAGGRWTESRKARLRASRVGPTRLLAEALARLKRKPQVLVSASALGYYGHRGDTWLTEKDSPADDFLGRLSVEWERATAPAQEAGIRVVSPRIGIVLSPAGGALAKMLLPFKAGLGGVVGPGTQYMSWIALDDLVGVIQHVLDRSDLAGPVNAVTPSPVTNAELTKTLGRVLGRPTLMPVPAFALRLALGEMADTLLASTRLRPERLLATGYRFRFPQLEGALRHVLGTPLPPPA